MCVLLAEKLRWPKLRVFLAENVNEGDILLLEEEKIPTRGCATHCLERCQRHLEACVF